MKKTDLTQKILSLPDDKIRQLYADVDELLRLGIEGARERGDAVGVAMLQARRDQMKSTADRAILMKRLRLGKPSPKVASPKIFGLGSLLQLVLRPGSRVRAD